MDKTPEPVILSTCGGKLKDPDSYPSVDYKGRRIYFCTQACLRAFENNPDGFMKGDVEHPSDIDE